MINQIQDETGAQISIEDDGTIYIGATDGPSADAARAMINAIANPTMPEVGERFMGTVVKTTTFGAFVSLLPGKDGLLHISEVRKLVGGKRIDSVDDVLKIGQKIQVELKEIDPRGKLSLGAVMAEDAATEPAGSEVPAVLRPRSRLTPESAWLVNDTEARCAREGAPRAPGPRRCPPGARDGEGPRERRRVTAMVPASTRNALERERDDRRLAAQLLVGPQPAGGRPGRRAAAGRAGAGPAGRTARRPGAHQRAHRGRRGPRARQPDAGRDLAEPRHSPSRPAAGLLDAAADHHAAAVDRQRQTP